VKKIFPTAKQPLTDLFHVLETFDKPFPRRSWSVVAVNVHKAAWECTRYFDQGDIQLFQARCSEADFTIDFEHHGVSYTQLTS
jgi:hypothetical protein